ncbi:beta-N-acetylhexosaminidase [Meiothermus sp. CFH 77666]|uniref:beta-N-acetylhexosaminidase n=1 Tax=Meiothermus sp. CFH 77666 TaxID=2817942 RepID=UPI001AA00D6E|nr:beta-N-acetylhexosaminidase [Meiothermus sp. CFH 77666]MBO1437892.1 beta-N-acetylhexosaminidase [Meiothermus sp. CFH 77666]
MESLYLATSLMMVDLPGPTLGAATCAHLERYRFGGVCLFRKNIQTPRQVRKLVADIRQVLGPEAWIAIDQEGGAVQRVLELVQAPAPMALGAIGDAKTAEAVGAAVGRTLISLGINWNFAPSVDVNTNPKNPVIGDRSFGSDPKKVARLALAWVRGLESAGVMATVKHFPGHGDTALDSHLDLPVVNKSLEELERTELYPFRKAVEAHISAIMSAHIRFPALDKQYPATLSEKILTRFLRQKLGFQGIIVTDALDMKAITQHYTVGEAAVKSLQAGADMILSLGQSGVQIAQATAIQQALEDGSLSEAQAKLSQLRLLEAAQRFPGLVQPYAPAQQKRDQALMERVALQSITPYRQPLRPKRSDRILVVSAGSAFEAGPYGETIAVKDLSRLLKTRFSKVGQFVYDPKKADEFISGLEKAASKADYLLVVSVGRGSLSPQEIGLLKHAFSLGRRAVHIALWNPYHILSLRKPAFVTYGFRAPTLKALVKVLGGAQARGRLPFKLR